MTQYFTKNVDFPAEVVSFYLSHRDATGKTIPALKVQNASIFEFKLVMWELLYQQKLRKIINGSTPAGQLCQGHDKSYVEQLNGSLVRGQEESMHIVQR